MRRLATIVVPALLILTACQTTSAVPKGQQAVVNMLIGSHCVIGVKRGNYLVDTQPMDEEIVGNSVAYGNDFWVQFDYTVRGMRDAAYHNIATGELICGRWGWNNPNVVFGPEPPWDSELVPPTPIAWADVRTGFRPFVMTWEGYAEDFAGRVRYRHRKRTGTTFAELPNGDGRCYGSYIYLKKGQGIWSTACTNGLAAFGEFTTDGEGGPGTSTGSDARGRDVRFTLGPLEPQS